MFFMVLDLRLVKDWLSGDNQFFYFQSLVEEENEGPADISVGYYPNVVCLPISLM